MNKSYLIRSYSIIGHTGFLILLVLSVYFYKERMVFIDNVYYLFKIVNFEKFNLEAGRYGAFLSQIPVLLGVKVKLSLKALMVVYSISFIFLYYGIYILCTRTLKNFAAGLAIVLLFMLCMKKSFYHPTHELQQAIAYCCLLFAVLQFPFQKNMVLLKYMISAILIVLAYFTYPVSIIILFFILAYFLIDTFKWKEPGIYILILLVIILAVYKKYSTREDTYEGAFLSELAVTPLTWSGFFNSYSTQFFLDRITGMYFWLTAMFSILIGYLIWKKEYIRFLFIFISTLGILCLLLIVYHKGDSDIMMERCFLPLVPIVAIPFSNELIVRGKINQVPVIVFIITIMVVGTIRINREGHHFRLKLSNLTELIKKTEVAENRKFLLKRSDKQLENIIIPWTFSFTTMVISSMESKDDTKTIHLYDDLTRYEEYLQHKTDIFLGTTFWLEWSMDMLNTDYFTLIDEPYVVLAD
jgi:hypothetical protein